MHFNIILPLSLDSLLYSGYLVFPGGKGGWGVSLTTHPHLVPRSRKSRTIRLLPFWVLVACYRVKPYLNLLNPGLQIGCFSYYKVYVYIVKHNYNYILGGMLFTICKAQLHVSAFNVGHLQVLQ